MCDQLFHGPNCTACDLDKWDCPGKELGRICNNHGACLCTGLFPANATCECDYRFMGNNNCTQCSLGYVGAECDQCDDGFFGNNPANSSVLICESCPDCGQHGFCNGSATTHGPGTCVCTDGYSGDGCVAAPFNIKAAIIGGSIGGGIIVCGCFAYWVYRAKTAIEHWQHRRAAARAAQAAAAAREAEAAAAAKKKSKKSKKHKSKSSKQPRETETPLLLSAQSPV